MGRTRNIAIDLNTQGGRLLVLMEIRKSGKTKFAEYLGWTGPRLSSYLALGKSPCGRPITKKAYRDLREKFPGITWEWIDEGNNCHLSPESRELILKTVEEFIAAVTYARPAATKKSTAAVDLSRYP